jgi:hypothetical protein
MQADLLESPAVTEAEEMAINLGKDDKAWIRKEIRDALAADKPQGFSKVIAQIKSWSPASAAIAVILFALAQWNKSTEFRVHTEDRLTRIEADLIALRVSQSGSNPIDKKSQAEAKEALANAKNSSIKIPPSVIERTGEKFIEATKSDPAAWDTALQFVNYRSFLNASAPQGKFVTNFVSLKTQYNIISPGGQPKPTISTFGLVPIDKAAALDVIGKTRNTGPNGVQYLFLDGGAIVLDGSQFKHIVLRNVHVVYRGGPAILEDVYFLNCTFEIVQENNGQLFASTVLASSPATNFKAG